MSSVALTFFAYLGFTVISFTGGDLPNPAKNLPKAMYLALAITTALYVLIALGVFGTLTVDEVIANGDTALAQAAKPALGQAGFAMMAVAALLATSSSVNANIYAAIGSTAKLAESGMFPPVFGQRAYVGGTRGLTISVLLVLLLAARRPHRHRLSGQRRGARDLPRGVRCGVQAEGGDRLAGVGAGRRDRADARWSSWCSWSRPSGRSRRPSSPWSGSSCSPQSSTWCGAGSVRVGLRRAEARRREIISGG